MNRQVMLFKSIIYIDCCANCHYCSVMNLLFVCPTCFMHAAASLSLLHGSTRIGYKDASVSINGAINQQLTSELAHRVEEGKREY